MTAPSGYLRTLRESQASRRLGVAKALRETPDATDIELAAIFCVSRNTIAEDRQALMEQLTKTATTEMELLREDLRQKLESYEKEVELHRKDGKLSLGAIDQLLSITKAVIELTGARKPVKEQLEIAGDLPLNVIVQGRVAARIPVIHGEPVGELTPGQQLLTEGKDE